MLINTLCIGDALQDLDQETFPDWYFPNCHTNKYTDTGHAPTSELL